jgi:methylase of polypeptide subunit release factors
MSAVPAQTTDFGPLVVTFDDRVLRPRPWTLLQASWAAELARTLPAGAVLELCSGAGHIGQVTALLTGRPLVQVDIDPHACALAEANAAANAITSPVQVRCGDLGGVLAPDERFSLVLADPPYLPRDEVDEWPDDPDHAVDGGPEGLDLLRRCLEVAGAHLQPGGVVLLQALGQEQVEGLAADLAAAGLALVDVRTEDDRRAVARLRAVEAGPSAGGGDGGARGTDTAVPREERAAT